jgi:MFS family permease
MLRAIVEDSRASRAAQRATGVVFFVSGFGMSAWAPLVPYAKARLGIDDGELGVVLLSLGLGSVLAMPIAGGLVSRFGCRIVIVGSAALLCGALPFLATLAHSSLLAMSLVAFGAGLGAIDVAMNIQAIAVERAARRAIMSGLHGLFGLGGMSGAAAVSAMLAVGASPVLSEISVAVISGFAVAAAAPYLLPHGAGRHGPMLAVPRGPVLLIGVLCFIGFLTEGSVLDWSAVFLISVHQIEPYSAGLGFASFSATMTLGRLVGDRIVQRVAGPAVIGIGGLLAAAGFALTTLVPSLPTALVGYGFVGVGCSNIVPVLFSSIGRQTEMAESVAVPAVTAFGYAGILVGPAAIGLVAHLLSLSVAFLILTVLLLAVAASGGLLRRQAVWNEGCYGAISLKN